LHPEKFLEKLEAELAGKKDDDAMKLKRDVEKARRTQKRHAKRKQST
jgi:hypothetical protein